MKSAETSTIENRRGYGVKMWRKPRRNINSVKHPTLNEKLAKQNSKAEKLLLDKIGNDITKPKPK